MLYIWMHYTLSYWDDGEISMSYARFGERSDIYVYEHVGGFFECCACSLAKPVKSIFTVGCDDHPLFGNRPPCEKCGGEGCEDCMMPGNTHVKTRSELIEHVKEHIAAGHLVPDYVISNIQEDLATDGETTEPLFEDGYDGPAAIDFKTGKTMKLTELIDGIEETED